MDKEKVAGLINEIVIMDKLVELKVLNAEQGTKAKNLIGKKVKEYLKEELTE